MSEFLQEYHLYGDMSRLNNETYFSDSFDVPDVNDFLAGVAGPADLKQKSKTLKIYILNLCRGKEKSAFVELKWLLCLHRALPNITNPALLERLYDGLSKMETPANLKQIDEFIVEGIVKPYIHVLAKLCLIQMQELDESNAELCNQENRGPTNHLEHGLVFIKYNLVKYAVAEMLPTIVELEGFFRAYYPVLGKLSHFLQHTLTALLQSIRSAMKAQRHAAIRDEEITQLEDQIQELDQTHSSDASYFDISSNEIGTKLSLFMESAHKNMGEETSLEFQLSQF